ncbi:hypothetical protein [Streptomyces avidinii]|uniref:Uncharacterized protein n=1 Tax=Streptomyces avidinii TaxID=1895 RepID=A0ABS4L6K5_STRAV|nr:hypothetical protein [Streptomyces avidinii]MBP2037708.1 hypothetical protein [Streptomyces avidinii]GGZ09261.1 hypothetical protein GCM10010343_39560 [Streptomyces avidinii]
MAMQWTSSTENLKKRCGGLFAVISAVLLLAACDPSATGSVTGTPSASVTAGAAASATPAFPTTSPSNTPSALPASAAPTPAATTEAPAARTTAPAPAATEPAPAPPAPTRTRTQAPAPEPTGASTDCYPRSNAGNCYKAGQICRKADVGTSGRDANGRTIHCRQDSSVGQRWGY